MPSFTKRCMRPLLTRVMAALAPRAVLLVRKVQEHATALQMRPS